jgi:hypothetical protein
VDPDHVTITVKRSLQNLIGRRRLKSPKTKLSRRTIPIDPYTVHALRGHE